MGMTLCLRRKAIPLLVLSASLVVLSQPSRADSDGYFCSARGYLAYELRSFHSPGLSGEHVLRVLRLGKDGITEGGEVLLEDFQVHELMCGSDLVEIAGWEKGYIKYIVRIENGRLRIAEHMSDPTRTHDSSKEGPEPRNLGEWSRPGVTTLESDDPHHKYQLIITHKERPANGALEHHRKTELVQVDAQGNVSQRLLLFEGTFTEYGD
jgi:hypothetical protein